MDNDKINITLFSRRRDRLSSLIGGSLRARGIYADLSAPADECSVIAAFDARAPAGAVRPGGDPLLIIWSGSDAARLAFDGCGLRCVTCGVSARDSITVSSISYGRAMLTVQRRLPTVAGGCIEQCELPLRFSGCDIHKALFASAVVLLCGGVPEEGGLRIGRKIQ